jgi:hypothetical protein
MPEQTHEQDSRMTKVLATPGGISPATSARAVFTACGVFMITSSVASAQSAFTLSGTIIGLRGSGLTLSTNGQNVTIPANATSFTFPTAFASGTVYNVTMTTRPSSPTQGCLIANAFGTVTANVTNIRLACVTSRFTVGGTVSGLVGDGLTLSTNGQTLAIAANGTFAFPTTVRSDTPYDVSIVTQPYTPNQRCVVTNASGTVTDGAISNIAVDCFSLAVTSSTPAAGATNVSRSEPLVLNFSSPLNALTVAPNWVDLISFPNGHRALDLSVSGSQLTLTPNMALRPGAAYTLEVRPGIRAVGGEGLADTVQINFRTREAAWQGAQDIGPSGLAANPSISSYADSFATVWRQDNSTLGLNRYSPRTGWSNDAFLHTGHFIVDPQVFLDVAGAARVIWEQDDGTLAMSRHTAEAGWTAIEQVPTDGTGIPRRWKGATDQDGNIFAIWKSEQPNGLTSIWANRYVPRRGWDTPVQLDDDTGGFIADVNIAVDPVGNVMAYWLPFQAGPRSITTRRYTRNSGWGPAETASGNDVRRMAVPHMTMRGGRTVAVYSRDGATGGVMANTHLGSGWETPQSIGTGIRGVSYQPLVAFDESGGVLAVWIQRGNGPMDEIWANARSTSGVWSSARRILIATERFEDLELATAPDGNRMIVAKDVNAISSSVVTGYYWRDSGAWLFEWIERQSTPMNVQTPRIGIDRSGSALAVWTTSRDGGGGYPRANVLE